MFKLLLPGLVHKSPVSDSALAMSIQKQNAMAQRGCEVLCSKNKCHFNL